MAQNRMVKKSKTSPSTERRLSQIEATLEELRTNIQQTQTKMNQLDQILVDLEELKRRKGRKRLTLFNRGSRKSVDESPAVRNPLQNIGDISELLQNPAVKSLLSKKDKGGGRGKPGGFDLSQITGLLTNPLVQSFLQNAGNKGAKSGKSGRTGGLAGLDMGQIASLLQNPMIQSLLKK